MSTCEYRIDEQSCGKPTTYKLTVSILDAPREDREFSHLYCRSHGPQAEGAMLIAAGVSGRLGQVRFELRKVDQ